MSYIKAAIKFICKDKQPRHNEQSVNGAHPRNATCATISHTHLCPQTSNYYIQPTLRKTPNLKTKVNEKHFNCMFIFKYWQSLQENWEINHVISIQCNVPSFIICFSNVLSNPERLLALRLNCWHLAPCLHSLDQTVTLMVFYPKNNRCAGLRHSKERGGGGG